MSLLVLMKEYVSVLREKILCCCCGCGSWLFFCCFFFNAKEARVQRKEEKDVLSLLSPMLKYRIRTHFY